MSNESRRNESFYDPAPKRRWGFSAFAMLGTGLALLAVVTVYLFLTPAVPSLTPPPKQEEVSEVAETAQPVADSPAPAAQETAAPEETPSSLTLIEPTPAISYVKTEVVADGESVGILASREAAEELLSEVKEHFIALTGYEGEMEVTFRTPVELVTADQSAEVLSHDELFALLTGEDTPIEVVCAVGSDTTEPIPFETEETGDKYLVKGTRTVDMLGRDGLLLVTRRTLYINGVLSEDGDSEEDELLSPVTQEVRVGREKVSSDAPGKREGKEGRDTELEFSAPIDGKIVSNFGQRDGVLHLGLDYEAEEGTPVTAAAAGKVVCVMERGGYGLMVEVDHGEGFVTRYAHLSSAAVSLGQTVAAGDTLGLIGSSGNAEGREYCLHFELRIDGEAYNPRFYL